MSLFHPIPGLIGGSIIGLAASTLLLGSGEIMGCSGIIGSFFRSPKDAFTNREVQWKLAFVSSFFLSVYALVEHADSGFGQLVWGGSNEIDHQLLTNPNLAKVSVYGYAISGFLVGLGTRLGNGCTTGHGICGLARFSKRSFAAVLSFMTTGILSATICGPKCVFAKFLRTDDSTGLIPTTSSKLIGQGISMVLVASTLPVMSRLIYARRASVQPNDESTKEEVFNERADAIKVVPAIVSGGLFAVGLAVSTMIKPSKIVGFLDMSGISKGTYDPTLITVMGGGVIVSFLSYQFTKSYKTKYFDGITCAFEIPPLLHCKAKNAKFSIPTNTVIDKQLIIGSMIFGLGWGIGGLCPGPAMFLGAAGAPSTLYYWWPAFIGGTFLGEKMKNH